MTMTADKDLTAGHAVTRAWRNAAGTVYALDLRAPDGAEFTIRAGRDGTWALSWADMADEFDVWANFARYGMESWTCPGHGGGVCQYGMCDEIRYPAFMAPDLRGMTGAEGPFKVCAYYARTDREYTTRNHDGDSAVRVACELAIAGARVSVSLDTCG